MEIIYWIVALWVIVGFIVAIAFGLVTNKDEDNDRVAGPV